MANCCENTIVPFYSTGTTTVPYGGEFGSTPSIDVLYKNEDGTFTKAGIFILISIEPTQIIIDHGGPATGFIKIY
jgi:hypothetical protein